MRIDLRPTDGWAQVCEQYRAVLPSALQDPLLNVQIYQGYEHALREIAASIARLLSHKRTVAIATSQEPAFESLAQTFSAEGFSIIELTADRLADPSSWLPGAQNDLLFVAYAKDDAVTGGAHAIEPLEKSLQTARVHRIAISYSSFRQAEIKRPQPFEVQILSLSPERALMVAGERGKIRPQTTDVLAWSVEDAESIHAALKCFDAAEIETRRSRIEAFEQSLPEGFGALFSKGANRVFDRAVVFHEGVDGSALIAELGGAASAPGTETTLESTSMCRWENPRFQDWLLKRGIRPAQARGLILIEAEAITADLTARLKAAADKIIKIQNG